LFPRIWIVWHVKSFIIKISIESTKVLKKIKVAYVRSLLRPSFVRA
jgi:hypothetical protein